jgi:glycosyltransferase involved in cell wall biosynthesis
LTGSHSTRTVLLVTESAFYPPYRGDSRRLFMLITHLRRRGWRVHVVHLHDRAQPDADYEAMARLCDGLSIYRPTDADLARHDWGEMDTYCPPGLVELTAEAARRVRPQVLVTQFVFLSRCLDIDAGGARPLRVIDADNKFAGRALLYSRRGIPYDWFSTDEAQERRGLMRADLVMAIQEREAEYFSRLAPGLDVVLVPHLEPARSHPPPRGRTLLFVGAASHENAVGLTRFLGGAFDAVRRRHPGARMKVAGRVCELVGGPREGVEFLGPVDDLGPLYAEAAVVTNPAPAGSGIKIKTVEALCHGRCLVTTRHGSEGLENYPDTYHPADTPDEFAATINSLFDAPWRIAETSRRAHEFARQYFNPEMIVRRLEQAILGRMRALDEARGCPRPLGRDESRAELLRDS